MGSTSAFLWLWEPQLDIFFPSCFPEPIFDFSFRIFLLTRPPHSQLPPCHRSTIHKYPSIRFTLHSVLGATAWSDRSLAHFKRYFSGSPSLFLSPFPPVVRTTLVLQLVNLT